MLTDAQRARTLERFAEHRRAWDQNAALREQYADWYGRVRALLPSPSLGPFVELGSGPGFARTFIPELLLTDVVGAPWHDREMGAEALPFDDGTVGAIVLFDVLHHLASPASFFNEASRALAPGGRIVLCEPYVSPLSFPVYKLFHDEPVRMSVDPLADLAASSADKDPFDSNQAIPTLLFDRASGTAELARRFPELKLLNVERLAGLSYPSSGGFRSKPMLPLPLWRVLYRAEGALPAWAFRLIGFRVLAALEKILPAASRSY